MGLTSGSVKPMIKVCYLLAKPMCIKSKISEEIQNHAGTTPAHPVTLILRVANPSIWAPPIMTASMDFPLSVPSGRVPFKVAQP